MIRELVAGLAPGSRVAIDGVDASGKTTLADSVPGVSRVSVDDFQRLPAARYARGRESAVGCYRDTFDHAAIRAAVLGCSDTVVVDGVFLQRPELADLWDLVVLLVVDDEEVIRRARLRDPGDPSAVEHLYRVRYLPAQRLYEAECFPRDRADVVLDMTDPARPVLVSSSRAPGLRRGPGSR